VTEVIKSSPGIVTRALEMTLQSKGVGRDHGRAALHSLVNSKKVHTAPGPRRATLHYLDDGCDQPADCAQGRSRDG
jgi:hypothetical protein